MINKDSRDATPGSSRFILRSVRPALAVSAVALSVFGLSQVSGTSAAWQDAGNTATSGGLTVAANVLPAIAAPNGSTRGAGGGYSCRLTWDHLGAPFKYKIYVKLDDGSWTNSWENDPGATAAVNTQVTDDINYNDAEYPIGKGSRTLTVEVHTVNRFTLDEGADWRGYTVYRYRGQTSLKCENPASNVGGVSGASQTGGFEALNARVAPTSEVTASTTPTPLTTSPTTTSPVDTTTATPPTTPITTTTSPTTPNTSTATTTSNAPSTTTTTAADTTLGAAAKSTSKDYSATLVRSTEFSQTALVISDANGEELKRISATASTQYKWDSSTDTLWIVEGGQLYRASGNSWTKSSVDPSSSDVPAEIAALVE